ncbi:glycoside hydrolase family 3 N-terminal domain-containing protein [Streptomyces sp. BE20]|uniref:glycoside hydrolase family 3 protein n=1 Tax=Streptomyces sp. BE20 TaxID=3002525 RepID=UPI002E770D09|nr:glycoside hydrolase family 3 N-terminal domain-containing protein [Streptomyces sp. BE20]MEE1825833.1 glycoside hydrolase family 3 N-terminal domain-containing protein [Streptomyces sp. BE20]
MTARLRHHDGTPFRDLNHNGTMEPYEDPRLPVEERVADLLGRMTLAEKAALMCHGRMLPGGHGPFPSGDHLITERGLTAFGMMAVPDARTMAEWNNHVQDLAAAGRLGIPVTLASDPRHGFTENPATAFTGGGFSTGPEPIGLAATDDPALVREYAELIGRELRAVGIRLALHPMADLATEPRWARISGTFGEDADRASRTIAAYIRGLQGERIGPDSVACMTKHFPGGGPQFRGEDSHFAAGRRLVYPGGAFEQHLRPFEAAFEAGTAQIMPAYAIPSGSGLAEVGANFNHDVITGLLRGTYGFDGVVCTDFNAITGMDVPGIVSLPPRHWGVEELSVPEQVALTLDAGADQLGGETDPELILTVVRSGAVSEARIDESVRRILRDKFRLGLFDDPYVDADAAAELVGTPDGRALGRRVQARSLVHLAGQPLDGGGRLYVEGVDREVAARYGTVVDRPEDADVAVIRLATPYERREGLLEQAFHSGSLEFEPAEAARLAELAGALPTAFVAQLERPAVLTPLEPRAALLVGEFGAADEVVLDAVFGRVPMTGSLPFDLPRSDAAVEAAREDVAFDTRDPLFRCGHPTAPRGTTA